MRDELAIDFATECLGWEISSDRSMWKGHRKGKPDWWSTSFDKFPPFSDDTPEGYAAHKQWVEPWIISMQTGGDVLEWFYTSEGYGCFYLYLTEGRTIKAVGPLPTASISACLELVRKEKQK